ncbi:MAG: hypothetical protein WBD40_21570 [Tepidisphaeraceae bacterium]
MSTKTIEYRNPETTDPAVKLPHSRFGAASLVCFALWVFVVIVSMLAVVLLRRGPYADSFWPFLLVLGVLLGVACIPIGFVLAMIGLFEPDVRRTNVWWGLVLHGGVMLVVAGFKLGLFQT